MGHWKPCGNKTRISYKAPRNGFKWTWWGEKACRLVPRQTQQHLFVQLSNYTEKTETWRVKRKRMFGFAAWKRSIPGRKERRTLHCFWLKTNKTWLLISHCREKSARDMRSNQISWFCSSEECCIRVKSKEPRRKAVHWGDCPLSLLLKYVWTHMDIASCPKPRSRRDVHIMITSFSCTAHWWDYWGGVALSV